MKIVKINKTGLFYKVKFDDDKVYKFHESVIISYGLIRKNIEIDEAKLAKALLENEYYIALDKGVNYLLTPKSKKEVLLYLKRYYDNDLAHKVLMQLENLKLLNDKEYAFYAVNLLKNKGFGANRIVKELNALDIKEEYISEAILEYSHKEMIENCEKALIKYIPSLKKESKLGIRKKATNYLLNRGFSNDIITIVLENNSERLDNISDEDELLYKAYIKLLKSRKDMKDDQKFKNKIIRSLTNKGFPLYKVLKVLEGGLVYDKK